MTPNKAFPARSLMAYGGIAVCAMLTGRPQPIPTTQDPCNHPIPAAVWAAMTPNQRRFQQLGDSLTSNFIRVAFGEGPYPPCLYQSVRDYFVATAGATPAEDERAEARRDHAAQLMRLVLNASTK